MVHHAAHHPNALAKYEHLNYRLEIFFSFLFRNDSMFFSNCQVSDFYGQRADVTSPTNVIALHGLNLLPITSLTK